MSGVSPVDGPFRMAVLRQPGTNVDVQFTGLEPIDPPQRKTMNQLGFVSDDAQGEMESVQRWCEATGLETSTGDYGPGFRWIDVPEVFLDFVLEVMDRKSLLATGYSEPEI